MSADTSDAPAFPSARARTVPLPVYAGLWFAVVAWGGSFVAARLLLAAVVPGYIALSPTLLAAARFSIASLFFMIPLARAVVRHQISLGDLARMLGLGQITYSLYFWLQYTGVQHTSASVASILVVGLIPLVTTIFAFFGGQQPPNAGKVGILLIGFAGVVVVAVQHGIHVSGQAGFFFGALCLVGNAVAFALSSILTKRWMRHISPLVMTGGTMIGGTLGLISLSLTHPAENRWQDLGRLSAPQMVALLFLAIVCSVGAYLAYNYALTWMPAARAAVYIYAEPLVALGLGVVLLGEGLSAQTLLGAVLITASVALIHRSGQ